MPYFSRLERSLDLSIDWLPRFHTWFNQLEIFFSVSLASLFIGCSIVVSETEKSSCEHVRGGSCIAEAYIHIWTRGGRPHGGRLLCCRYDSKVINTIVMIQIDTRHCLRTLAWLHDLGLRQSQLKRAAGTVVYGIFRERTNEWTRARWYRHSSHARPCLPRTSSSRGLRSRRWRRYM